MAKKETKKMNEVVVSPDKKADTKKIEAPKPASEMTKSELNARIKERVEKYNKMRKIGAFTVMKELRSNIDADVTAYNKLAEAECYAKLGKKKAPLLEAAKTLEYDAIAVRDEKEKDSAAEKTVVKDVKHRIDPRKLHDRVKGGIGANKEWKNMAESLNCFLTCRRGFELGLDPEQISNTYKMSDAAAKVKCFLVDYKKFDEPALAESTLKFLQEQIDAMIGEVKNGEGEVLKLSEGQANWLLLGYQKIDTRAKCKLRVSNHGQFAKYMLELCHCVINEIEPDIEYKTK